jgi:hypothetical protein
MVKTIAVGIIMKRYLFIVISILLVYGTGYAETYVPAGPVSGTWTLTGSPYLVEGEIRIRLGTVLTIEPGVEVIFQGPFKFIIRGQLWAVGTEADSITFTAVDASIGWHGFRFYDLSAQPDSSKLMHCKISNGRSANQNWAGNDKHGGAIYCSNSDKLLISHCLIWNNRTGDVWGADGWSGNPGGPGESATSGQGGAIYCIASELQITSSVFHHNRTGNAAGGEGGDAWNGSGISGGQGGFGISGEGGVIYSVNSTIVFDNNILFENKTGEATGGMGGHGSHDSATGADYAVGGPGGDGGYSESGSSGVICLVNSDLHGFNNAFFNNTTGGAYGGNGGFGGSADNWQSPFREYAGNGGDGGNSISGNGGCIYVGQSTLNVSVSTFTENDVGVSLAGHGGPPGSGTHPGEWGLAGRPTSGTGIIHTPAENQTVISNSIVWEGAADPIDGPAEVTYSCVYNGFPGIGNISNDPIFTSLPFWGYFLAQTAAGQAIQSPCVDAGCPDSLLISGTTRTDAFPDIRVMDMGFHHTAFDTIPYLIVSPDSLDFVAGFGGSNPDSQMFIIKNNYAGSFYYNITENATWLSCNPMNGGPVPPHDSVTVSVDISDLQPGTYPEYINVTAPNAINSPDSILVTLQVTEPVLSISTDNLVFNAVPGENPPNQTFEIMNTAMGTFDYEISENISWLSVTPENGGPIPPTDTVTVSIDVSSLPIGTYEGDIIVEASLAAGSPQTIHVILNVDQFLFGPVSGTLTTGTYRVIEDITVASGDTLIIEPGTTLLFVGPQKLLVEGYLEAIGTESDSIRFLACTARWAGIEFNYTGYDEAILDYCYISDSDSGAIQIYSYNLSLNHCTIRDNSSIDHGGGICCYSADLTIQDCFIYSNYSDGEGGGVYCNGNNLDITNSTISSNASPSHGGISAYYCSGSIENCTVNSNSGEDCGGISFQFSDFLLTNCSIEGNAAYNRNDAGGLLVEYSTVTIENCSIHDNYGSGIIYDDSDVTIFHSFFTDNNPGAGIRGFSSTIFIENSDIVGNYYPNTLYGSGIMSYNDDISLINSIISYNLWHGVKIDSPSEVEIAYCNFYDNDNGNFIGDLPPELGVLAMTNLNGDSCDIFYNIFEDPMFISLWEDDFHLMAGSPCIDAGDPESLLDPDSTIADIGAFYYDQSGAGIGKESERIIPEMYSLHPPYPNPFNPVTTIRFGLPVGSWVRLEVFDICGRLTESPLQGFREAGYHEVTFDASHLASGIYFYRIQAGDFTDVKKMVLVK